MNIRKASKITIAIGLSAAIWSSAVRPAEALFDKTRFAAHLGVAYFCFHHWVSKPFKEGAFTNGAPHRNSSIVKAGGALLFGVHELKVSNRIAHESRDPLLQKLAGSLDNMTNSFSSIGDKFKSGNFNPSDVGRLNQSVDTVNGRAQSAGINVKDVPVAIPGS